MSCPARGDARTRIRFPALLLVLALAMGACGRTEDASPRPAGTETATVPAVPTRETSNGDQVVVLAASGLTTLDPYLLASICPGDSVAAHIWDTMVWLNDRLELEPRLAESWGLVDDLTWEVKLRQDVVFHNGEPFDAQAVKFSLERTALLEGSLETFASDVELQSVEVVDRYTVRIRTAEPAVSLIYELSTVEMLPPVYYAQTGLEELSRHPVGSGPYRLADWEPGERVVLEANADYWKGAPAIRTLVFQTERDGDSRLAGLVGGDADLVVDLVPEQAAAANTGTTRLEAIESTRRLFVGLRYEEEESNTPLADKTVRQALNYAVDVEALVDEFHAGYGQRYGSWVNPPHDNSDLPPWPYDPEKARELLAQAGYPDGFDITMDAPAGRYYRDLEIAEAIAAQLADVGVRVTVQPWEWSAYRRERLVPRTTAPLFLLGLASRRDGLEDTENLAYGFPFNPTRWYNQEFERLLDQAARTFSQTFRQSLLLDAQAIAYEEAPWIWLWRPYLLYGVSQDLDWWHPRADGLIYLYARVQ